MRAAESECADCHPDEVEAWGETQMGRSWGSSSLGWPDEPRFPEAGLAVQHPRTGVSYRVRRADGQWRFSDALGPPRVADQVVGSGAHTRSGIWTEGGVLRVMPLTWYAEGPRWDLSPGYEAPDHPGFSREITADCLYCHSDPIPLKPGTETVFTSPPPGPIGCSRCHGDARAHVSARLEGVEDPGISSPSEMPPARAADVCGYCHLQGEVRVLREGRGWGDFAPGGALHEVVAVFGRAKAGQAFNIASQAERLGRSRCAQVTGPSLNCTTCHTPHPTGDSERDRAAPCRGCHGDPQVADCAEHAGEMTPAGGAVDCVRCHMRRSGTADIPHVTMTDHFIRRRPEAETARPPGDELIWLNRPADVPPQSPTAQRLRGQAYAEAFRASGDAADRERALALLQAHLTAGEHPRGWFDLASMRRLKGDLAGARAAIEESLKGPESAKALAAAAELRLATGAVPEALAAIERAVTLTPHRADRRVRQATALFALGRGREAEAALERAQEVGPRSPEVHLMRGALARARGDRAAAVRHFEKAVQVDPGHAQAWLDLCRTLLDSRRWAAAKARCTRGRALAQGPIAEARFDGALSRVWLAWVEVEREAPVVGTAAPDKASTLALRALKQDPRNPDALFTRAAIEMQSRRWREAISKLDVVVTADPYNPDAWWSLGLALEKAGQRDVASRVRAQARRLGHPGK